MRRERERERSSLLKSWNKNAVAGYLLSFQKIRAAQASWLRSMWTRAHSCAWEPRSGEIHLSTSSAAALRGRSLQFIERKVEPSPIHNSGPLINGFHVCWLIIWDGSFYLMSGYCSGFVSQSKMHTTKTSKQIWQTDCILPQAVRRSGCSAVNRDAIKKDKCRSVNRDIPQKIDFVFIEWTLVFCLLRPIERAHWRLPQANIRFSTLLTWMGIQLFNRAALLDFQNRTELIKLW